MIVVEPQPRAVPRAAAAVALHAVSFRYPDGQHALHDLSLGIAPGEHVALMGPNGAGKSTLLQHLNGVLGALDGSVQIDGMPVQKPTLPRVRAAVGLVFQDPDDQLFSPTVFDDVAFGPLHMNLPPEDVHRRVARALDQVDMAGFEGRVPHHLSLGQRKRIALATVLSMDPTVLALDEPSAGLDPRARTGLVQLLRALPHTLVVSTHDLLLAAEVCGRAVVLNNGTVVYDGACDVLLNDQGLLASYGLV